MPQSKKIILVGGSTAGHILPLFAIKEELEKKRSFNFLYIGSGSHIEKTVLKQERVEAKYISCGKFRRSSRVVDLVKNLVDIFKTLIGIFQSFYLLSSYKPDLILSKSGFVAVPVALCAKILSIPLIIHESDVVPGLATRICSPLAHAVITAFPPRLFPKRVRKKAIHGGLPIRSEYENLSGLSDEYIVITGGSSGSLEINKRLKPILPELLKSHKIVHITGTVWEEEFKNFKNNLPEQISNHYVVCGYEDDMPKVLKKAKLVISRAGASTIFEIGSLNKKSLLIPISSGVASHQIKNALFLKKLSMAKIVEPADSSRQILMKVNDLLTDRRQPQLKNIIFPKSAKYIADLTDDFLKYFELRKFKNVFLIGIQGVSMRAIAVFLESMGINVKGSDLKDGGHARSNLNIGYDLVVYSSAADEKSPAKVEHQRAKELHIPIIKRSQMIGLLMGGYRGISVSGMHGKTTVSSLIAKMISLDGLDPSYLIGMPSTRSNKSSYLGTGIDFVAEACEYDGSFLDFNTKIAVITNIEEEHLDYFKGGLDQIKNEFRSFIKTIHPGGALVYCQDDQNVMNIVKGQKSFLEENKIEQISYGFSKECRVKITDYKVDEGKAYFKLNGQQMVSDKVGEFFALNSAASYGVCKFIAVDDEAVYSTIKNFQGASRRTEFLGEKNGIKIFDDYGHHPTEIMQTLKALNEKFPKNRKIVIFEPHQQKRFNDFFDMFVESFACAPVDVVGILPVYKVPGRDEKEIKNVGDLVAKINNPKIIALDDYEMARNFLQENLKSGDVLFTMGATDVYKIAQEILRD